MTITMVFTVSTPSTSLSYSSSSSSGETSSLSTFSNSSISIPKNAIPQLGFSTFSQWNGLKHLGISISHYTARMKETGKRRGKGVYASLFGVGVPEALVIGVVALLVFGPKGLAEVARNLGKTLRAFQPTIRELQEVSREFKSTLEREIGLDDIDNAVPQSSGFKAAKPTPEDPETSLQPYDSPSEAGESSADSYLKVSEVKLMGALAQLQKEQAEDKEREEKKETQLQAETITVSQDTPQEAASPVTVPSQSQEGNSHQEAAPVPATKLESET